MGNELLAASEHTVFGQRLHSSWSSSWSLFGLLYFVTIRPQRNRQRAAAQTQSRDPCPGRWVRTTA